MRGKWVENWLGEQFYVTDEGGAHAQVNFDSTDKVEPWVAWTAYTEGNDRFSNVEDAKRRAETRLEALLKATESLRD